MTDRDFENLNGIYDEIKNAFGVEVTLRFYSMFKGQQISFPMYLFDKKYIAEKIKDEYDGSNSRVTEAIQTMPESESFQRFSAFRD